MLIEHIADFHIRNAFGMAPLHVAAGSPGYGRDRMIDHGADPNVRGSTPLHHSSWWKTGDYAPRQGTVEGTCVLLKHGAIMDVEDNEGRTPLQLALEHGREDIVTCLKEHGATQ